MKIINKYSIEKLQKIIRSLSSELQETKQELKNEKLKNAHLLEQFRLARQEHFAPKSEKNIYQADLFDEAAIECEEIEEDKNTSEVKSHLRKKHPVRKALSADLPREQIIHDLKEDEKICDCGIHLSRIGEEITEQLKFIPAKLSVIQHVRYKYACRPCQENVRIAPMPILLLPKTNATPELIAHTIISKYADHIPLYRQAKIWNRVDIDLPRSTLCGWLMKVGEICEPLVNLLHRNLIAENYLQADESPIQVLNEPGRNNTSKSYLWIYQGGGNVVFDYQQTRAGYNAQNFLQNFKGFLQTDAYSGYSFAEKSKEISTIGCMAHARRPFAQLAKLTKKEGLTTKAIEYFKSLYAIETYARENSLTHQESYVLRNEKALPILHEFKEWLTYNITKVPKQHQIGKAIYYTLNNWEALTRYLNDGRIEIDNNKIENLIRPLALGRKNFLFMGSPQGAKASAIFYSLIATCTANGIEAYKYFCAMLHQIRHCKTDEDYRRLMPQNIMVF
ncbi:MAG: IS66 family transposase [Gammaproteobacteria bacterium]